MTRLRQVPRSEVPDDIRGLYELLFGDRDPVAEPGTDTGTPGNWWTVFALVPDCFRHAVDGFRFYRDPARELDPVLREFAQTRAGYAAQSQFVYSQHCKALRALGVDDGRIAALSAWQTSALFTDVERAVLAWTDCLVLEGGRASDATFAALKLHLSDAAILELSYVTCTYAMHATLCRALRLEYDDVPERIVEIPAPGDDGGPAADAMAVVDDGGAR
ncbi:MAG TPA: carboxymuconolactone decarboxylase family protein [Pseudomonadales bacterium]|nr:carboxymuconolactone decarboxylase family protein [Pseudomonadales bacterium]